MFKAKTMGSKDPEPKSEISKTVFTDAGVVKAREARDDIKSRLAVLERKFQDLMLYPAVGKQNFVRAVENVLAGGDAAVGTEKPKDLSDQIAVLNQALLFAESKLQVEMVRASQEVYEEAKPTHAMIAFLLHQRLEEVKELIADESRLLGELRSGGCTHAGCVCVKIPGNYGDILARLSRCDLDYFAEHLKKRFPEQPIL